MNAQALTDAAVAAGMDDATTVRAFVARNCGKARLAPGGVVVADLTVSRAVHVTTLPRGLVRLSVESYGTGACMDLTSEQAAHVAALLLTASQEGN